MPKEVEPPPTKNKKFFELKEDVDDDSNFPPQMVRIEIEEEDDALPLLAEFEPMFEGRNFTARKHECNHGTGAPCHIAIMKVVSEAKQVIARESPK